MKKYLYFLLMMGFVLSPLITHADYSSGLLTSLVSHYSFDGSSADSLGSHSGSDTSVSYVSGFFGQSASFDGSSSVITFPSLGIGGAGAWSFAFWVDVSDLSHRRPVFVFGSDSGPGTTFQVSIHSDGSICNYSDDSDYCTSSGLISTGSWYYLAFTYDGSGGFTPSNLGFYVNGVKKTITGSGWPTTNIGENNYQFGEDVGGGYYYAGLLDNLDIWSRVITADEVIALYNGGDGLLYESTGGGGGGATTTGYSPSEYSPSDNAGGVVLIWYFLEVFAVLIFLLILGVLIYKFMRIFADIMKPPL